MVEIMVDLGKQANIGTIALNTARGNPSGVRFPTTVAAFVGADRSQFQFVGNVADDSANVPGPYQIRRFSLGNVNVQGRYVLLLVQPDGPFFFTDEIEVTEAASVARPLSANVSISQARDFSRVISRLRVEQTLMRNLLTQLETGGSVDARRKAAIEADIAGLRSTNDSAAIEDSILALRAEHLTGRFPGQDFVLDSVNPWGAVSPVSAPSGAMAGELRLSVPQNGFQHAGVLLTNVSTRPVTASVNVSGLSVPGTLSLFEAQFVKSAAVEFVADALLPVNGTVRLRPGESKLLFLTAYGTQQGLFNAEIAFTTANQSRLLNVTLDVGSFRIPATTALNSVNWGYLDFKPIAQRKPEAVRDMLTHHTNVVVVPPTYMPCNDRFSASDSARLTDYLRLHAGFDKVMLFFNFNNGLCAGWNSRHVFMSAQWRRWFTAFYPAVMASVTNAGFSPSNVFAYPFDEMQDGDVARFVQLAAWARTAIPGIRFYGTLDQRESLRVLPQLDIAQVIDRPGFYDVAAQSGKPVWLYGAAENTKSLSPYSYYRLMAWRAFVGGFSGVGFWNYADTGSGANASSAWDDFDGRRPDFSVIYDGSRGEILSSRRWEAWRLGIEDYEILNRYAQVKGEAAAKALAKSVVDAPNDIARADQVRQTILEELR
ncbi:MAG: hypothetical protein CTY22_03915 [Methylomonas sp.]|nr:MAG: hypothetical protein CTY22_03915 [Methylomonas sp.]PPD38668.1 MAG: hypothetical protein CTY21_03915 [Methylomonas sp.]PPD40801.1 MAG: hypothetical protein CTY17_05345 [Methylomonas sp.]PPD52942.1 MAG: hypothetical protein CTY11_07785 [Methylomonas sp.]